MELALPSETETKTAEAIALLKQLISIPAFSKGEKNTADLLQEFLQRRGLEVSRHKNNVWCYNKFFSRNKPWILLNSHHDTVKPNAGYTKDPFNAEISNGKIYGLGSNDAGGPLVALLQCFLNFYWQDNLKYNLIFAATAEEEISGTDGIECILNKIPAAEFAIVGEPTSMKMAVAQNGLLVLDCISKGTASHAAHSTGDNAIYNAIKNIEWFRNYEFEKISATLGKMKMNVTMIQSGTQHNVIPDECKFTIDIRVTDDYTHEEVLEIINKHVDCEVHPRSTRLGSSGIAADHPIVNAAKEMNIELYGSPTLSDLALIPVPGIKIGPGDSTRSHTADEFIYIDEIEEGIRTYIDLLKKIL